MSRQFNKSPRDRTGRRPEGPKRAEYPDVFAGIDVAGVGGAAVRVLEMSGAGADFEK